MANRFLSNITVNDEYTFPSNDGSAGQAIITDGSGNLSFGSAVASSADSTESVHIHVKNTSGSQILKGTPVYVTGETGNSGKIEIAPADASDSSKMPALGLLESTLDNNSEGFCVQGGLLEGLATATIDGTSTTANDTVYVKAGGGLTMTKPTGSNLIQNIAKVVRVHASNGSLVVSSILRTNDVPNLTTGKIWVGDGNTVESTVVHLDEGNERMGIGTTSPFTKLDVAGNAKISDNLAIGSLSTVPTASLGRALNIQVLANSSGTTVAQWLDIDRTITTNSTSAFTYGMVLRNASTTTSTANDGNIYGAQIIGRHQGTGGINSAMGVRGTADIDTTGNITATGTLWGAYNDAQVTNGSVTFTNSGIFGTSSRAQVLGSGTVNISSQGIVGIGAVGVINNVNATVNRVVGGEFELDLQNGTTNKAHVVSLNTFNIVSPTNLSIDEFAYIYLGEDVAIPTTITDNAYFIKSLTSLPSELAGSIEATSFIKTGGTSSQFLKADGSIDSTSYAPATGGSYLPLAGGTITGNTLHGDNVKSIYGTGSDLEIFHDGSNSYIQETAAAVGNLNIIAKQAVAIKTTSTTNLLSGGAGSDTELSDTNGVTRLALTTSDAIFPAGNVGIGTTSPSEKLEVNGNILVGNAKYTLTVNAPSNLVTTIVSNTIDVTFTASTTTNIDNYLVFSSVDGGDYGLISVIPPADFGATMSIIDDSFDATGTQAYRVYAVKNGVYSSPLTGSIAYSVSSAEPTNMSVVSLNSAYYVQWDPPSSNARFVTAYNVYKHEHATQGSLSRSSATLIYSGLNTNYMYQISGVNNTNFHQFWVETTIG